MNTDDKEVIFNKNKDFITKLFVFGDCDELCYIQTMGALFIFNPKKIMPYYDFMKIFLVYHSHRYFKWKIDILDKNCDLYREHYKSFNEDNVILHKYIGRFGLINHTIISEHDGKLFTESEYLGLENYHSENKIRYVSQPKREIIPGVTLSEYVKDKSEIEKIAIFRNYFDWLFVQFPSKTDPYKLDGIALDAHSDNVIVNENGFHFVDRDVIYAEDVKKSLVLWDSLGFSTLFQHFINYYGLPPETEDFSQTHPCLNQNTEDMQKAAILNHDLLKKYFSDIGLRPHLSFNLDIKVLDVDVPTEIIDEVDVNWYKKKYGIQDNAAAHYMTIGWKQGFNPSPNFDGNTYLEMYPDIKQANMNPLYHYVLFGKKEGRQVVPAKDK